MTLRYQYAGITEQKKAGVKRMLDAEALRSARKWRGAMYLGGYGVECQFKVALMQAYGVASLRKLENAIDRPAGLWDHSFDFLLSALKSKNPSFPSENLQFHRQFNLCRKWRSNWRYHPEDGSQAECEDFLSAVRGIRRFMEGNS